MSIFKNNRPATLAILVLAGVLLAFTSYRAYDFISRTMPANQQSLGIFGLFALGVGSVIWLIQAMDGKTAGWPRTIAIVMTILCASMEGAIFWADSRLVSGENGLTEALSVGVIDAFLNLLAGAVVVNLLAVIAYKLLDPERARNARETEAEYQRLELEHDAKYSQLEAELKAEADFTAEMLKGLPNEAKQVGAQFRKDYLDAWKYRQEIKLRAMVATMQRGGLYGVETQPHEIIEGEIVKPADNAPVKSYAAETADNTANFTQPRKGQK